MLPVSFSKTVPILTSEKVNARPPLVPFERVLGILESGQASGGPRDLAATFCDPHLNKGLLPIHRLALGVLAGEVIQALSPVCRQHLLRVIASLPAGDVRPGVVRNLGRIFIKFPSLLEFNLLIERLMAVGRERRGPLIEALGPALDPEAQVSAEDLDQVLALMGLFQPAYIHQGPVTLLTRHPNRAYDHARNLAHLQLILAQAPEENRMALFHRIMLLDEQPGSFSVGSFHSISQLLVHLTPEERNLDLLSQLTAYFEEGGAMVSHLAEAIQYVRPKDRFQALQDMMKWAPGGGEGAAQFLRAYSAVAPEQRQRLMERASEHEDPLGIFLLLGKELERDWDRVQGRVDKALEGLEGGLRSELFEDLCRQSDPRAPDFVRVIRESPLPLSVDLLHRCLAEAHFNGVDDSFESCALFLQTMEPILNHWPMEGSWSAASCFWGLSRQRENPADFYVGMSQWVPYFHSEEWGLELFKQIFFSEGVPFATEPVPLGVEDEVIDRFSVPLIAGLSFQKSKVTKKWFQSKLSEGVDILNPRAWGCITRLFRSTSRKHWSYLTDFSDKLLSQKNPLDVLSVIKAAPTEAVRSRCRQVWDGWLVQGERRTLRDALWILEVLPEFERTEELLREVEASIDASKNFSAENVFQRHRMLASVPLEKRGLFLRAQLKWARLELPLGHLNRLQSLFRRSDSSSLDLNLAELDSCLLGMKKGGGIRGEDLSFLLETSDEETSRRRIRLGATLAKMLGRVLPGQVQEVLKLSQSELKGYLERVNTLVQTLGEDKVGAELCQVYSHLTEAQVDLIRNSLLPFLLGPLVPGSLGSAVQAWLEDVEANGLSDCLERFRDTRLYRETHFPQASSSWSVTRRIWAASVWPDGDLDRKRLVQFLDHVKETDMAVLMELEAEDILSLDEGSFNLLLSLLPLHGLDLRGALDLLESLDDPDYDRLIMSLAECFGVQAERLGEGIGPQRMMKHYSQVLAAFKTQSPDLWRSAFPWVHQLLRDWQVAAVLPDVIKVVGLILQAGGQEALKSALPIFCRARGCYSHSNDLLILRGVLAECELGERREALQKIERWIPVLGPGMRYEEWFLRKLLSLDLDETSALIRAMGPMGDWLGSASGLEPYLDAFLSVPAERRPAACKWIQDCREQGFEGARVATVFSVLDPVTPDEISLARQVMEELTSSPTDVSFDLLDGFDKAERQVILRDWLDLAGGFTGWESRVFCLDVLAGKLADWPLDSGTDLPERFLDQVRGSGSEVARRVLSRYPRFGRTPSDLGMDSPILIGLALQVPEKREWILQNFFHFLSVYEVEPELTRTRARILAYELSHVLDDEELWDLFLANTPLIPQFLEVLPGLREGLVNRGEQMRAKAVEWDAKLDTWREQSGRYYGRQRELVGMLQELRANIDACTLLGLQSLQQEFSTIFRKVQAELGQLKLPKTEASRASDLRSEEIMMFLPRLYPDALHVLRLDGSRRDQPSIEQYKEGLLMTIYDHFGEGADLEKTGVSLALLEFFDGVQTPDGMDDEQKERARDLLQQALTQLESKKDESPELRRLFDSSRALPARDPGADYLEFTRKLLRYALEAYLEKERGSEGES